VDPDRSFERIYRRHRREVYGSVLRDVRDPVEAEDVTQAAFLNAYRAMRRGDRPEKPRAWLITIARNVVRRRARLRAERPQEVELDTELLATLEEMEGSASEDICAALRRLTDAQREAILLREIQGRSYAEIAEELMLSVPAVEALLFRARRALAEELALVDRSPVVRPRKRQGFLALPGLAKLGTFGFSFGRASVACLVGCAVIATVPVGGDDASQERAPAPRTATRNATAAERVRVPAGEPKARPHQVTNPSKRHSTGTKPSGDQASAAPSQADEQPGGSSLLPVEAPQLPVQLPPVKTQPLPAPQVELQTPPLPDVTDVLPLPTVTS
jgi:RNA polymerase sigma factor (sigma-70 family)